MRVLVVDDDEDFRHLITLTLEGAGATVVAVGDAYQALERLRTDDFEVVVLDLLMPGANGVDLMERARRAGVTAPMVVLTALEGGRLAQRAAALGAAVLPKGAGPSRLLDLLREVARP